MLALLATCLLITAKPLTFEMTLSPPNPVHGDTVRVELRAENRTDAPIVVAKALWDGAPAASASVKLTRDGQEVLTEGESSMPSVQVAVSNRVDVDRFVTLGPGESVVLYFREFAQEYDFHGAKTRMKQDYARATLHPLAVGNYTVEVRYDFEPENITRSWQREWNQRIDFGRGAKELWDTAFRTKLSFKRAFSVR